jgi:hypothetical protein
VRTGGLVDHAASSTANTAQVPSARRSIDFGLGKIVTLRRFAPDRRRTGENRAVDARESRFGGCTTVTCFSTHVISMPTRRRSEPLGMPAAGFDATMA